MVALAAARAAAAADYVDEREPGAYLLLAAAVGPGGGPAQTHRRGDAVDFMLTLSGTTSAAIRAEGDMIVAWLIANQVPLHLMS